MNFNSPAPLKDNFQSLIENNDYFKKEVDDVFRNLFDSKDKYRRACKIICELKHASVSDLVDYSKKESKGTAYATTLSELVGAGVLSYTKSGNQHYYYCASPLIYFYFFFEAGIKFDLYENWRGNAFELMALANLDKIQKRFNQEFHDPRLNFIVREEDLEKNGSKVIKAQIDLLVKVGTARKPLKKFQVFELKAKTLDSINTADVNNFVKRISILEHFLSQKISVELIPAIIALEENAERNIFSLPKLLLSD